MIPIKIVCQCGQKYSFEVEPVGGRMPGPTKCPVCGTDGTIKANEIIAQSMPARPPAVAAAAPIGKIIPPPTPAKPGPVTAAKSKGKGKVLAVSVAVVLLLGLLGGGFLFWNRSTLKRTPNRAALEKQIAQARQSLVKNHVRKGSIVMGQVVLDGPGDPRDVAAQMDILEGGYFAGTARDLDRPIGFRMHGYAPLDLDLTGKTGDLIDVHKIRLVQLPPAKLCALTGHVILEEATDSSSASVSLKVVTGPVNSASGGTSSSRHWAGPILAKVDQSGQILGSGFSPMEYSARFLAPGYVSQYTQVIFVGGQAYDVGTIKLEKAKLVELTYFVTGKLPFDLSKKQTATVEGGGLWKADKNMSEWDLQFKQKDGEFTFSISWFPGDLTDLGEGSLEGFINIKKPKGKDPRGMKVQRGHVYWFNAPIWRHSVLFKVE